MPVRRDTIAAIATPPGNGGIGIIRVSGPDSLDIATAVCGRPPEAGRICYAWFRDRQGVAIDQGIILYFRAPQSYTGEDVIEFQGHGGQAVLNLLLKEVTALGARLANPGEFTERAFLNDRIDLAQAEAVADLIESVSESAVRGAARSLEGEFSGRVRQIVRDLVDTRVTVEGALDFPEEEIDFIGDTRTIDRLNRIQENLDSLLVNAREGKRLREGARVTIFGRPNVGKSTLLNRLAGTDRAIVTEIAGTTRDVIEQTVGLGGLHLEIVDTAGIREPDGPVEEEGIRRSLAEMQRADFRILVTDSETTNTAEDDWISNSLESANRLIVLHNKIDLYHASPHAVTIEGINHVFVSMKTGEGVELVKETLCLLAAPAVNPENTILARERHIQALEKAASAIRRGTDVYRDRGQAEMLAEELKEAQASLGRITGEVHSDELLGEIFSRFCIGK